MMRLLLPTTLMTTKMPSSLNPKTGTLLLMPTSLIMHTGLNSKNGLKNNHPTTVLLHHQKLLKCKVTKTYSMLWHKESNTSPELMLEDTLFKSTQDQSKIEKGSIEFTLFKIN